jgi:hypothetical protein
MQDNRPDQTEGSEGAFHVARHSPPVLLVLRQSEAIAGEARVTLLDKHTYVWYV